MTIRAHRPESSNRINLVVGPKARQEVEVMDMSEAGHHLPVYSDEIEAAEEACCTIMADAFLPGTGITLVTIDQNALHAAFTISCAAGHFLGNLT
jgi:hypothetical protein